VSLQSVEDDERIPEAKDIAQKWQDRVLDVESAHKNALAVMEGQQSVQAKARGDGGDKKDGDVEEGDPIDMDMNDDEDDEGDEGDEGDVDEVDDEGCAPVRKRRAMSKKKKKKKKNKKKKKKVKAQPKKKSPQPRDVSSGSDADNEPLSRSTLRVRNPKGTSKVPVFKTPQAERRRAGRIR
jgi:hypothetical protein